MNHGCQLVSSHSVVAARSPSKAERTVERALLLPPSIYHGWKAGNTAAMDGRVQETIQSTLGVCFQ